MLKQRRGYFDTQEGIEVKQQLKLISNDSKYNTRSTYHPNSERFPDNLIPFVEKHMDYLIAHPQVNAWIYVTNVKMGTLIRG